MKYLLSILLITIAFAVNCQSPLVLQPLDYTENPIDIPNPDRGFYITRSYIVPVESELEPDFSDLSINISGTTVPVDCRIVYMSIDLKNFSSNAPLHQMPAGPWGGTRLPDYGTTQPLTPDAIDYVRSAFQQIRESEAVAMVKFNYDGFGNTYINRGEYRQIIHDCEPGAPRGRAWYESGGINGGIIEKSDLCGISGHEDKNWVQYHLWQLSSVFNEFEDVIMCVKGGFFGPWGEMHSSSYAETVEGYHWLMNALLNYVPTSRSILVHTGGVMAWHNVEYGTNYDFTNLMPAPEKGTAAQRFGMANDSYSRGGSDYSDEGKLYEGIKIVGGEFNRNTVLTWIRDQKNFYCGASVGGISEPNEIYPRFPNVPYEAAYTQTVHLNTVYSGNTYKLWSDFIYNEANVTVPFTPPHDGVTRTAIFDPVYDGRNGVEFMRDRLGYRLVLREARTSESIKQDDVLRFEGKIQNVGFGLIVNKKNVSVILKSKADSNTFTALTNLDARNWLPDLDSRASNIAAYHDLNFSINMSEFGDVPVGNYDIYMKINDSKEQSVNRRCIRFANKGNSWNVDLGANLIGSITVAVR